MSPTGIKYMSVEPGTGYGESAAEYISGLRASGVPVTWCPLVNGSRSPEDGVKVVPFEGDEIGGCLHDDICNLPIDYDTVIVHIPPRRFEPWLELELDKHLISYCTWESDCLPEHWPPVLNRFDHVLVPSDFNRETFIGSGVTVPVSVIPHIATRAAANIGELDGYGDIEEEFVFYSISTWTTRKAVPETITAFLDGFDSTDDAAFVLKTTAHDQIERERLLKSHQPDGSPVEMEAWWSLAQIMNRYPSPPKLHLIQREVAPWSTVEKLHSRGDCLVSLTRGEGFGLTPFEAASRGNPVVVTGWGGQLEYLPPDYPFLVDYELVPMASSPPDGWLELSPDHNWAEPDVAHATKLLRELADDRDRAAEEGELLRDHIEQHFSVDIVTDRLLGVLAGSRPVDG